MSNREILFRGKAGDKWRYGDLKHTPYDSLLIRQNSDAFAYGVTPETVGQYTGLTDKNEKKIFEGDIIEFNHPFNGKSKHIVVWDKYKWNLSDFHSSCFDSPSDAFSEGTKYMEVIGNAHDNLELLKNMEGN